MQVKKSYWFHIVITFVVFVAYCDTFAILRAYHQSQQQLSAKVYALSEEEVTSYDLTTNNTPLDLSNFDKNIMVDWRRSKNGEVRSYKPIFPIRNIYSNNGEQALLHGAYCQPQVPTSTIHAFFARKCPIRI